MCSSFTCHRHINLSPPHGKFAFCFRCTTAKIIIVILGYQWKTVYMRVTFFINSYVLLCFHNILRSSHFNNFWLYFGTKWKRACDTIEAALRTHLILPRGRSDCSDIKLVLLRREALLVREMADTSLTSLSDDLAETLSQLLYWSVCILY